MNASAMLEHILDREVGLHKELLAIARARHLVVQQGRETDLQPLRLLESTKVHELRALETARSALSAEAHPTGEALLAIRNIATLMRRIGAVERATRLLVEEQAWRLAASVEVRPGQPRRRHLSLGIAVSMKGMDQ